MSSKRKGSAPPKAYLAGPEVFLLPRSRAFKVGSEKKKICARYGFEGAFPLDEAPQLSRPRREVGLAIFRICVEMMDECDLVIANMTPFRGPSMDVGSAVEVGYMYGRGKPVFGYTNIDEEYRDRIEAAGIRKSTEGVENFGFVDNLMIEGAVVGSGNTVVRTKAPRTKLLTALEGFETCVQQARDALLPSSTPTVAKTTRKSQPPGRRVAGRSGRQS